MLTKCDSCGAPIENGKCTYCGKPVAEPPQVSSYKPQTETVEAPVKEKKKSNKKLAACKSCGKDVAKSAKKCPHCGAKIKKPIYKKWWFWLIIVLVIAGAGSSGEDEAVSNETGTVIEETNVNVSESSEDTESVAPSTTPEEMLEAPKDLDIAPVVSEETSAALEEESDSSGLSLGKINALASAKTYLALMAFSYEGLIDQLEFEQFSTEDATYAADQCGADWNEQALKSAKGYLDIMAFSYSGLIEQLEFEGFTSDQATYGADNCGADWNEEAAESAESYLDLMSFSREGLIEQLMFEGFTHEQAVYGVEANGY